MDSVDFEKIAEEPLVGIPMKKFIDKIYEAINDNEVDILTLRLTNFRTELISHYLHEEIKLIGYPSVESAKTYFSQFLQYIFQYVEKNKIEKNDKKILSMKILSVFAQEFFFKFNFNEQQKITLWIDKQTGDSTLTTASQYSDHTILQKILENLKNTFTLDNLSDSVPEDLERYLFHENKLGRSALSLIWMRQDQVLENSLFKFAENYYKDKYSQTFQKFLFQVDADQNTALMRAARLGSSRLFHLIINNIDRIYGGGNSNGFKNLLLFENTKGETLTYELIRGEHLVLLKYLIQELVNTFEISDFRKILFLDTAKNTTPLIEAVKSRNLKIINELFKFSTDYFLVDKITHDLLMQQDAEGYTALMRAVEMNYQEGIHYFFNILINLFEEDITNLLKVLRLKTKPSPNHRVFSVFQLAASASNWEVLEELIDLINFTVGGHSKLITQELIYVDENGINTLTKLYREENAFRLQRAQGKRISSKEIKESARRLKLARLLAKLGQRSPERAIVPHWISLDEPRNVWERVHNFFNIFCSRSRRRSTRSEGTCFFSDTDFKASLPENSSQIRKEALINLVSVLRQENLDSIHEIGIIRNSEFVSDRERDLLEKYSQLVTRYSDAHASALLSMLKNHVSSSLEDAFKANKPYILVDNQQDLLVLEKGKLFSGSLFNPVEFISLDPTLTTIELKAWLDTYFGSSYTLHPFDPDVVVNYPHYLWELTQEPIISDSTLLTTIYEGLQGRTIKELFVLDGKPIKLPNLNELSFFSNVRAWLYFRAERFHEIFFDLTTHEQKALKNFFYKYQILPANYPQLSVAENEYLTYFGTEIREFITHSVDITPANLFNAAIQSHEQVLSQETTLSSVEKNQIFTELRALRARLDRYEPGVHTKAALQLLVLLLPSVVRGVAKKDPLELAAPIGLIAADVALRKVLIKLMSHPQVLKIFSGELSSKILGIVSQTADRVPIVGSALVVYGLYQSGKALINAESDDPNRPYYAHLLVNNLVTAGVMGTEIAVSLPFWPVLGLFSLLTVDQIATEGGRIHDVLLHLEDDVAHPLLKFYTKLQLGLGIVNGDIQILMDQRQLFDGFLRYLDKVRNMQGADALVAVFLPEVHLVEVQKVMVNGRKAIGCINQGSLNSNFGHSDPAIYPQTVLCSTSHLVIDRKTDYYFSIGELNSFCERRDPFNVEHKWNYTLLVGTESKDCSLGQRKAIRAMAQASEKNAAGILVNTHVKESNFTGNYRFFAPIDPRLVKTYKLNFLSRKLSEPDSVTDLEEWLPCAKDTPCITHVRVAVTPLYSQIASDIGGQTKISINDDELRNICINQGVRSIEYLLSLINNVTIEPNHIPEQTFAFFSNKHYLQFENASIKSENGFQAQLVAVKKLTLDFTDKAWIEGLYQVPATQQVVVNQLKGISEERATILDVTHADSFSSNLGQYTQLNNQGLEFIIRGNFTDSALEVYRYTKNMTSFYHLLKPIESIHIRSNTEESLLLTVTDYRANETVLIEIKAPTGVHTKMLSFAGKYKLNAEIFFSRIIMYKAEQGLWTCNLEIDTSTANKTQLLDLDALQKQNFDKVSILTKNEKANKKTHYLFYQLKELPVIKEKFVSYRLVGSGNGWLLILKHVLPNEETNCYIGGNTQEIIIDNVRYQIKHVLASLFAVGTGDGGPINGRNLIANIKIEDTFSPGRINLLNDTYRMGNLSFEQIPLTTKIYFSDRTIPFVYLEYRYLLNQLDTSDTVPSTIEGKRLDGRVFIEANVLTKESVKKPWLSRINGFFISAALATTAILTGTFFMFIKRFKRTTLPAASALTIPLVEIPNVSASSCEEECISNAKTPRMPLCEGIENLKAISPNKIFTKVNYTSDLNTQLFFANYLLNYSKKKFTKVKSSKVKRENIQITTNNFYPFVNPANEKYTITENNNESTPSLISSVKL